MGIDFELMVPGAKSAGEHRVSSPWDLSDIGMVPTIDAKGAEVALQTAYAVFRDKKQWLKPEQRIAILEKTASIIVPSCHTNGNSSFTGFFNRMQGDPGQRPETGCLIAVIHYPAWSFVY